MLSCPKNIKGKLIFKVYNSFIIIFNIIDIDNVYKCVSIILLWWIIYAI